ncbi:DNA-directed RNA polymerase subunit alpha [Streptomyces purpurascens]
MHNPDLVLATLNGKGKLEMELTVERGRGYVSAVQNKQVGQEIGRIPVDSIYSPRALRSRTRSRPRVSSSGPTSTS